MSKRNPETLNLVMDYSALMESCAAYCEVTRPTIREPEAAYRLIAPLIAAATNGHAQESFFVILLDTKNKAIAAPSMATLGLLNTSPVHPREVFRAAIQNNAASVILVHNHPSGDPTPSKEDIECTRRLVEAGKVLGIAVTDHLIVGRATDTAPAYMSLREKNLVSFT